MRERFILISFHHNNAFSIEKSLESLSEANADTQLHSEWQQRYNELQKEFEIMKWEINTKNAEIETKAAKIKVSFVSL